MSEAHLLAPARSGSSRRSETTIDAVEVIVTSPGRNFVTVKVTTSGGTVGWGDATLNGRELAVASYLRDHLAPILLGRDAHRIQDTWQYLYRGVYWRGGPVAMAAISAIDMALWDIKGKIAGLPVYQLLGGASRTGIRAYGHATGRDIPELLDSVAAHRDSGFTAVRIQTGVPGLGQVYGIAGADAAVNIYEPAAAGRRPTEETWDSSSYLSHAPRMFAAVREAFGTEVDLLHDVHHRLTPVEAARLGKTLEEFTPFWLEDVTPAESPQVLALVRQHTTVPLAIGEVFTSVHDYEVMFRDRLIDFVRSAPTHAGGITGITRILQAGALGGARSALHGPTDVSPVGMAAALHVDLTVHNFGIQECMPQADVVSTVFRSSHGFRAGAFSVSDTPGLGVEVDEEAARAFPYQRAYLPVARLRDGTMHDW